MQGHHMKNKFMLPVNFDNAATTFPKPIEVQNAVAYAVRNSGGNAGRGGHTLTMKASKVVYDARQSIAEFFDADAENVIFTLNCTHALNYAIQGIMSGGGHIIMSAMEHNSVSRPIAAMAKKNMIRYSIAKVYADDEMTVQSFRNLITADTKAIVCTIASNVTGRILPYKQIAELCRENNICFIADGAQACGILPVKMSDGINILCTAGHKGIYGITGTGLFISDGKYPVEPLIFGGTGSGSSSVEQPDFFPDALESGTVNVIGVASLKAGVDFIKAKGINNIFEHENALCRQFILQMQGVEGITIYRHENLKYVPIVSFNIDGKFPEDVAEYLNSKGFCMRAGFHCAALAHNTLGTLNGTVRFAPSIFNSQSEVMQLAAILKKYR